MSAVLTIAYSRRCSSLCIIWDLVWDIDSRHVHPPSRDKNRNNLGLSIHRSRSMNYLKYGCYAALTQHGVQYGGHAGALVI